ncbi:hypothetical protein FQN50_003833 [Emmonsiellopsis sp. PD_5]|nr:hypothetical protein FQN50_003833 [Emmonsiellopsis sp. PD_5]
MHSYLSAPFLFILLAAFAVAKPIGVELPRRNAYGGSVGPAKSSVTIPSSGKGVRYTSFFPSLAIDEQLTISITVPGSSRIYSIQNPTAADTHSGYQGSNSLSPTYTLYQLLPRAVSILTTEIRHRKDMGQSNSPKTYPTTPSASVKPVKPTKISPPSYQTPSIPAAISPTTYSKPPAPTPTPPPQSYYSNNNNNKNKTPPLPPTEGSGGSYRLRIRGGIGGLTNIVDKVGDTLSGGNGGKKKKGGSGSGGGGSGSAGSAPKRTAASHKPSEASVKKSSQPAASATASVATKVGSASASASKTRTGGGDGGGRDVPKVTGVPSGVKSGGVKDPKANGKTGSGSVPRPKDKDKDLGVGLDARGYMRGGMVLAGLVVGFLVIV